MMGESLLQCQPMMLLASGFQGLGKKKVKGDEVFLRGALDPASAMLFQIKDTNLIPIILLRLDIEHIIQSK